MWLGFKGYASSNAVQLNIIPQADDRDLLYQTCDEEEETTIERPIDKAHGKYCARGISGLFH